MDTFINFACWLALVREGNISMLSVMKLDRISLAALRILATSGLVLFAGYHTPAQERSQDAALSCSTTGTTFVELYPVRQLIDDLQFLTHLNRIKIDAPIQTDKGGGYLGVYLGDVNEVRAKQLQLAEARGAIVGKVVEGSPAARAGLQENDVILSFDDQKVLNRAQFFLLLIDSAPGKNLTLGISRNGETQNISVEIGYRRATALADQRRQANQTEKPLASAVDRAKEDRIKDAGLSKDAQPLRKGADEKSAPLFQYLEPVTGTQQMANAGRFYLGVTTSELNEQLAQYFNVARGGVLVTEVTAGGLAEGAGIKAGDCIIRINDDAVTSTVGLNALIESLFKDPILNNKTGVAFTVSIVREGKEQAIKI
jgi:C-terminal processing protease CtpA/Prc